VLSILVLIIVTLKSEIIKHFCTRCGRGWPGGMRPW